MAATKPVPGSGETRTGGTRVCHALLYLTVAMCAWLALARAAHAADASEFWPEANGFFGLGPYEIYLAPKDERVPSKDSLNALGLVAKWYY